MIKSYPTVLSRAILTCITCSSMSAIANADEPHVILEAMSLNFEDYNRYAVPESDGATGLVLTNRETPQMVSLLNQARIKDQNLQTMKEVLDNTTGINVINIDGGRLSFSSRGFGIEQFSADGADMDFNAQMSVGETLVGSDIYDSIEVTHGATGLVTGSGEPSARVNMVRKKAVFDKRRTEVSANLNRFGNYGISLDHGQSLTPNGQVRGRMVLNHQDGDTFIDREERGRTSYYATVQADLGARTMLDIGAVYRENKQKSVMWGGLPSYFSDGTKTDWDTSMNNSVDWASWNNKVKEYFANLEHGFNDDWKLNLKAYHMDAKGSPKLYYHNYNVVDKTTGVGLTWDKTTNSFVIPDPSSHSRYRADNTTKQTYYSADIAGKFRLFNQEHKVMFGASRHEDKRDAYGYTATSPAPALGSLYTWDGSYPEPTWSERGAEPTAMVKATEESLFAAVQLRLAEPLSVILGSRLSDYDKSGVQWGRNVTSKADKVWTPYAGIIYDVNDYHSIYASYTSIFKPQTVRDVNGDFLDPEEGNTYELGLKSSSGDGKLQGQVTIFRTAKDNARKALTGVYVTGTENTTKEQAYTTTDGNTSTGVEMEVSGKISPYWQAMMSFAQFNAKDSAGSRINTTSSDRMMKLWTVYDMSRFIDGVSVGGGVNWYGERYAILTNPATQIQEKYKQDNIALVNLMARYKHSPNLEFQLNLSNVLNKKHYSGSGFNQLTLAEPFNISGSVTFRF